MEEGTLGHTVCKLHGALSVPPSVRPLACVALTAAINLMGAGGSDHVSLPYVTFRARACASVCTCVCVCARARACACACAGTCACRRVTRPCISPW